MPTFSNTSTGASGTIQSWTVPASGTYQIETWGAQGGTGTTFTGGLGAYMSGTFALTAGDVLRILVGQQGGTNNTYKAAGGGGGTFVVKVVTSPTTYYASTLAVYVTPLVIAGGGSGGGGNTNGTNGQGGGTGTSGGNNFDNTVIGGASGNGGGAGTGAGGGGGFINNGGAGFESKFGYAFLTNGGLGGTRGSCAASTEGGDGGFGGGSGGEWCSQGAPGAGGGYSGGAGTGSIGISGAGGSYNAGTSQANTAATRSGHGQVIITQLTVINLTSATPKIYLSAIGYNYTGAVSPLTINYGTTTSYGSNFSFVPTGSTGTVNIGPLVKNTLYHCRLNDGANQSSDFTFTTKDGLAVLTSQATTNITATSMTLNGTITGVNE